MHVIVAEEDGLLLLLELEDFLDQLALAFKFIQQIGLGGQLVFDDVQAVADGRGVGRRGTYRHIYLRVHDGRTSPPPADD